MNLKKIRLFIILFLCYQLSVQAKVEQVIPIIKKENLIIEDYNKLHRKFFNQSCRGDAEQEYYKLMRAYRGDGFFVPIIDNTRLDLEAIKINRPIIVEKIKWIGDQIKSLKTKKNLKTELKILDQMEQKMGLLLELKESFNHETNPKKKNLHHIKSEEEYLKLKSSFFELTSLIPYMLSYRFPVNHYELRKSYDTYKEGAKTQNKKKANRVYLLRRILQDGAVNKNGSRWDRFARANIDNLFIKLNSKEKIIPEDVRYDLVFATKFLRKYLDGKTSVIIERMTAWKKKSEKMLDFYDSLVDGDGTKLAESKKSKEMMQKLSKSRYELKDYTLKKQGEVYNFWQKQSELMKALYVIETILFNEVGSIDGPEALERRDVAQVVVNRRYKSYYNTLDEHDAILPYLKKYMSLDKANKEKWLNVLFKTAEFSFTYYFIGGSVNIYCPSMTRRARYLRDQNLKIALEKLKEPTMDFRALRYFSRASMLGRIDMTYLWEDYIPLSERPGQKIHNTRILEGSYRRGKYQYYYTFQDSHGRDFDVIEIKDKPYSIYQKSGNLTFYGYRNPHYFKYFKPMSKRQRP